MNDTITQLEAIYTELETAGYIDAAIKVQDAITMIHAQLDREAENAQGA